MKIEHFAISSGINFIEVGIYESLSKISLIGYFKRNNVYTDKNTIGIWKIKYKNQNL
jgi:hypothetical protein